MEHYQEHKALILNYYRELEGANPNTVGKVIQEYASPDIEARDGASRTALSLVANSSGSLLTTSTEMERQPLQIF